MDRTPNKFLVVGAALSAFAALLHLGCIVFGAPWYRFLGAGERMAQMDLAGHWYPKVATLVIASILLVWSLYALSGAGVIRRLPLTRLALSVITGIYLLRGVAFAPLMTYFPDNSMTFWLFSSAISLALGVIHLIGLRQVWTQLAPAGQVEMLPFDIAHRGDFARLNLEWVEAHFEVEPHDREQLEHPERILEAGGEIWLARLDDEIVGTGALCCNGDGEYEVAKMAVTPRVRGRGIGRLILEQLIHRFRELGGRRLTLETNAGLVPAIALYRRLGFVDYVPARPSEYARANVFMEWRGA